MTYMHKDELKTMNEVIIENYQAGLIEFRVMDNYDQAFIELSFEPREVRLDYMFPWEYEFEELVFTTVNDDGVEEQWTTKSLTWKCPSCRQMCTPEHGCPDCDEWPTGLLGKPTTAYKGWNA